ncbi:MAG: VCBS repeat-containing protein [Bacteroidales bacterium]|nr:VCBS repeat-containing protein [Bacteroidales bacterium]
MNEGRTPALLVLALLLQLAAPCALQAQEPDRSVGNNHSIALDYYLTDTVITLSSQENEHSYYYTARDEVRLLPGFRFSAENGKVFSAKTDPALLFPPKEGEFVTQDGTLMADPFQGYVIGNTPSTPYYAVGGVPGTLTVSATGAAVYSIPIECPEGAGGLTPQLSLVYNSQSGDGLAGWGWDLAGLSSIARTGSTLYHDNAVRCVQLDTCDNLVLDGQRLVLVGGTHWQDGAEYRTEVEAFSRVTYHTSDNGWFKVETRDGLTMEYRQRADLPSVTGGVSIPCEWLLTSAEDANGNYMTVVYSSDAGRGEYHPTGILYGGNSRLSQGAQSRIGITYEDRPDTFACYVAGHRTVPRKRIKYIDTYHDLGQSLFRRYALSYYAGGRYSRLSGVEEGLDGLSGMDKRQLTPIHFTWGDGVTGDSYPLDSGFVAFNTIFADMNGDGLSDIVCYRHKSDYTIADSITILHARRAPDGRIVYDADQKVGMVKYFKELFVADFNGDGLNDLIYKTITNYFCYYDYHINIGSGFHHVSGESVKLDKSYDKGLVGDFDGDGRFDLLVKKECRLYDHNRSLVAMGGISDWGDGIVPVYCPENSCLTDFNGNGKTEICIFNSSAFTVYAFDGIAFSELSGFQTGQISSSDHIYPGDYNGDGLTDLLVCRTNRTFILFSTGLSFAETELSQTLDDGDKAYTGDFNGDGLTDLVSIDVASTATLRLSLAIRSSHGFDLGTVSVDELSRADIGTNYHYLNFVDIDGDGCDDMVCTGTSAQAPVRRFGLREPVRVTRIADALGDTTRITYAGIGGSDVCGPVQPDTYPLSVMSQPSRVVSLVESPASRVGHSYRRPLLHRRGKGFLGFMEMTSADSLSGMATTTSYALTDSHYYTYPQRRTVSTFSGIPVSSTTTSMGVRSFPGIRFAPHQSIVCQKNHLTGDSITLLLVAYDSVENPTLFNTVHGNLTETHHLSYTTAGSWCPDKIARDSVIISQGNDSQTRVTAYTYDDRGNTLTVTTDPGDAKAVTTTYGNYDFWGHARRVQVSSGGETRTATSVWSADGRFLLSETDALGQTVSYTYDTSRGLLTRKTDPTGVTTYSYDSFGRLREEVLPDGRRHAVRLLWAGGERLVQQAVWYSYEETSGESPLWTWYDALGREVCRQYYGRGEQKISVFTEYDSQGRLWRTSEPTFANGAEVWAETRLYDTYGRISSIVTPVGTTAYSYKGLTTTVTSPSGTVTTVLNTAGQKQSVTTNGKTVSYTWYPSGQMKTATPQGGLPLSM